MWVKSKTTICISFGLRNYQKLCPTLILLASYSELSIIVRMCDLWLLCRCSCTFVLSFCIEITVHMKQAKSIALEVVVEDIATATIIYFYYRTRQIVVPFQVAYDWILRWLARIRKLSIPLNCFIWPVLIRFGLIEIIRRNLGRLWPLFLRSLLGFTSKYWLSFTWTNLFSQSSTKIMNWLRRNL